MQENLITHSRALPALSTDSRKNDPDGLSALVAEVVPQHSCLVFCSTKKNCESVSKLISSNLPSALREWKSTEKLKLARALGVSFLHLTPFSLVFLKFIILIKIMFRLQQESGRLCPVLRSTLPYGIAYHHSGLTADERQLIEEAFTSGTLCCLCCTSTLAAGVNLPARRVY